MTFVLQLLKFPCTLLPTMLWKTAMCNSPSFILKLYSYRTPSISIWQCLCTYIFHELSNKYVVILFFFIFVNQYKLRLILNCQLFFTFDFIEHFQNLSCTSICLGISLIFQASNINENGRHWVNTTEQSILGIDAGCHFHYYSSLLPWIVR